MKFGQATVRNELHLFGGLRAITNTRNHLTIFPTMTGSLLECLTVTEKSAYYNFIRSIGLDLIGQEQHIEIEPGLEQSIWQICQPNRHPQYMSDDLWSGIANTARGAGNKDAADLAKHIAFALRTSGLRLRDCASEYAWQNDYAISQKLGENMRFSNIKSFDLYMALHSLLADMGTARDYLGHFISRFICRDAKPVDSMTRLHERAKSGKLAINNARTNQLVDTIIAICNPKRPDGWMAHLGEYRNIIIHRAPIGSLSKRHLQAKTLTVGEGRLYQIHFGVSRDPFSEEPQYVDALEHFRQLLLNLLDFALNVAIASEIKPSNPRAVPAI